MATETSAPRLLVVTGRPSWMRFAVCIVAAAGAMTLLYAAFFGVVMGSSPLLAIALIVAMVVAWAPLVCWAAYWVSIPAVLAAALLLACLTHRYRLPAPTSPSDGRRSRWRRFGRVCTAAVLVCGAWALMMGIVMLLSAVFV